MPAEPPARRIPETTLAKLFGPVVIAGGIAWIVHLARPKVGTMFDNDNVGPTVVFGAVALIIIIIGIFLIRSSMRVVAVEGPWPGGGGGAGRRGEGRAGPS